MNKCHSFTNPLCRAKPLSVFRFVVSNSTLSYLNHTHNALFMMAVSGLLKCGKNFNTYKIIETNFF